MAQIKKTAISIHLRKARIDLRQFEMTALPPVIIVNFIRFAIIYLEEEEQIKHYCFL